jgi:hypothetical protein
MSGIWLNMMCIYPPGQMPITWRWHRSLPSVNIVTVSRSRFAVKQHFHVQFAHEIISDTLTIFLRFTIV